MASNNSELYETTFRQVYNYLSPDRGNQDLAVKAAHLRARQVADGHQLTEEEASVIANAYQEKAQEKSSQISTKEVAAADTFSKETLQPKDSFTNKTPEDERFNDRALDLVESPKRLTSFKHFEGGLGSAKADERSNLTEPENDDSLSARLDEQKNLTAEVAPVVDDILRTVGADKFTGKNYLAQREPTSGHLQLIRQTDKAMIMEAKPTADGWQPMLSKFSPDRQFLTPDDVMKVKTAREQVQTLLNVTTAKAIAIPAKKRQKNSAEL